MKRQELPLSFVMALAQNETALKEFNSLSKPQQETVINKTRKINSKYDMECFVNSLSEGSLHI